MADLKKKHHASGSLARRILTISILLLVIPLFFQSLFLYRQEYSQHLEDTKMNLTILAKERAHLIKELIQMDWVLLNQNPNSLEQIPAPPGLDNQFILVSKTREAILIGKRESTTNALVIPIPFSIIARDIPSRQPIRISLIGSKGKVAWENIKFADDSDLLISQEPIPDTSLSLQLAIEKRWFHGLQLSTYYFHFATLVFFVGVLGGGAVYLFIRRINRPLKNLCRTMERVSEGAAHVRYTPDRMGFEINELGIQFNETLDDLLKHSQEAERERLKREKLAEELRIGHEIQSNLSPSHLPGLPGVDLATAYISSKEVNGDFYDLFRLDNGQLLIAVCDTAGKGISACIFSLGLRSMIRALASTATNLSEIVKQANDLYWLDAHESSMFSTLWLGLYNPKNHHLTYCSQGHPPAILHRGSKIEELWTGGIPLGAQKIDIIETKKITLKTGDRLLVYTDGIIEAHDIDAQLYGRNRLYEFILRQEKETSQQLADQLVEEVHLFSRGAPQHDDMTLIAMHIS